MSPSVSRLSCTKAIKKRLRRKNNAMSQSKKNSSISYPNKLFSPEKLLIMCCFCSVSLEMKFIAIRFYTISLKQNESAKSSENCEYTQNKV